MGQRGFPTNDPGLGSNLAHSGNRYWCRHQMVWRFAICLCTKSCQAVGPKMLLCSRLFSVAFQPSNPTSETSRAVARFCMTVMRRGLEKRFLFADRAERRWVDERQDVGDVDIIRRSSSKMPKTYVHPSIHFTVQTKTPQVFIPPISSSDGHR